MTWRGKNKKIRDFGEQIGDSTESQEAGPQKVILEDTRPVAGKLERVVGNHDAECPGEGGGSGALGGVSDGTIITCSSRSSEESGLHGLWKRGQKPTNFFSEVVCWH